jgi:putative nucleotidyltransferase with HDIG domain
MHAQIERMSIDEVLPISDPSPKVFWDLMRSKYGWCRDMEACDQDSTYHAEGNVFVHSRMVHESLVSMPEFWSLSKMDRIILFLATALHDVGKPRCTRNENGSISSPRHSIVGAKMARMILPPELSRRDRESIVSLIRYHGLPVLFTEKEDPVMAVIEASYAVNMPLLAMLAKADNMGRTSGEGSCNNMDAVDMFPDFCSENGCWHGAREFMSDHSRYMYFRGRKDTLYHQIYDDTRFTVVMMVGLPGSGKDKWLSTNSRGLPIISLDDIRDDMGVDPEDNQGGVIQRAREDCRALMRTRTDFAFNATNVTLVTRRRWIDLFSSYGGRIRMVCIDPGLDETISRNHSRDKKVPDDVINDLWYKMDTPTIAECHSIEFVG